MKNTPLLKGSLSRIRQGKIVGVLEFQFNPTTIRRKGNAVYKMGRGPGSILPVATFAHTGDHIIDFQLLYDARENYEESIEGLRGVLAEIESLVLPPVDRWSKKRNNMSLSPDRLILIIGTRRWYCECTDYDIEEQQFNYKLHPVRATITFTLHMINPGAKLLQAFMDDLNQFRKSYALAKPGKRRGIFED